MKLSLIRLHLTAKTEFSVFFIVVGQINMKWNFTKQGGWGKKSFPCHTKQGEDDIR